MLLGGMHDLDGIVFTDVVFEANRLRVALEDPTTQEAAVRTRLDELSIPQAAVEVTQRAPIKPILRQERRPLVGGIHIMGDAGGFLNNVCTLGGLATRNGVRGFVTASHCSTNRFSNDNSEFWQPERGIFNCCNVGRETVDPAPRVLPNCPPNRMCRYSDANFVAKESGVTTTTQVARISYGTTTWNGTSYWRVTSMRNLTMNSNAVVTKVGRTTGRTSGGITDACIAVPTENITLLCQFIAATAARLSRAP